MEEKEQIERIKRFLKKKGINVEELEEEQKKFEKRLKKLDLRLQNARSRVFRVSRRR